MRNPWDPPALAHAQVMITSTDNTDVIITRADAGARGTRGARAPASKDPIQLDDDDEDPKAKPQDPEKAEKGPGEVSKEAEAEKEDPESGLTFV